MIPDAYFDILARIESGGQAYIKARTSSASGLFQFIRATWKAYGGEWGDNLAEAFGGLKPSIEQQRAIARAFTETNAKALDRANIPVNMNSLYAAHFLGSTTAIRILRRPNHALVEDYVSSAVIRANAFLDNMTVAGFKAWLAKKTKVPYDG